MEKELSKDNLESVKERQFAIAKTCVRMAYMLKEYDFRISKICGLTAFSLDTTFDSLNLVNRLYWTVKNTTATSDESRINPATIYEIERLLQPLRPNVLDPDYTWKKIIPLCKKYKTERDVLLRESSQYVPVLSDPAESVKYFKHQRKGSDESVEKTKTSVQKTSNAADALKKPIPVDIDNLLGQHFSKDALKGKGMDEYSMKDLDKTINDLKKSINQETEYKKKLQLAGLSDDRVVEKNKKKDAGINRITQPGVKNTAYKKDSVQNANLNAAENNKQKLYTNSAMNQGRTPQSHLQGMSQLEKVSSALSQGKSYLSAAFQQQQQQQNALRISSSISSNQQAQSQGNVFSQQSTGARQFNSSSSLYRHSNPPSQFSMASTMSGVATSNFSSISQGTHANVAASHANKQIISNPGNPSVLQKSPYSHVSAPSFSSTPGSASSSTTSAANQKRHCVLEYSTASSSPAECARIAQQIAEMHVKQRAERERDKLEAKKQRRQNKSIPKTSLTSKSVPSRSQISELLSQTIKGTAENTVEKNVQNIAQIRNKILQATNAMSSPSVMKQQDSQAISQVGTTFNTNQVPHSVSNIADTSEHNIPSNNPGDVKSQKFFFASAKVIDKLKKDKSGNVNISDTRHNKGFSVKPVFSMVVPRSLTNPDNQEELVRRVTNMVKKATVSKEISMSTSTTSVSSTMMQSQIKPVGSNVKEQETKTSQDKEFISAPLPDHVLEFLQNKKRSKQNSELKHINVGGSGQIVSAHQSGNNMSSHIAVESPRQSSHANFQADTQSNVSFYQAADSTRGTSVVPPMTRIATTTQNSGLNILANVASNSITSGQPMQRISSLNDEIQTTVGLDSRVSTETFTYNQPLQNVFQTMPPESSNIQMTQRIPFQHAPRPHEQTMIAKQPLIQTGNNSIPQSSENRIRLPVTLEQPRFMHVLDQFGNKQIVNMTPQSHLIQQNPVMKTPVSSFQPTFPVQSSINQKGQHVEALPVQASPIAPQSNMNTAQIAFIGNPVQPKVATMPKPQEPVIPQNSASANGQQFNTVPELSPALVQQILTDLMKTGSQQDTHNTRFPSNVQEKIVSQRMDIFTPNTVAVDSRMPVESRAPTGMLLTKEQTSSQVNKAVTGVAHTSSVRSQPASSQIFRNTCNPVGNQNASINNLAPYNNGNYNGKYNVNSRQIESTNILAPNALDLRNVVVPPVTSGTQRSLSALSSAVPITGTQSGTAVQIMHVPELPDLGRKEFGIDELLCTESSVELNDPKLPITNSTSRSEVDVIKPNSTVTCESPMDTSKAHQISNLSTKADGAQNHYKLVSDHEMLGKETTLVSGSSNISAIRLPDKTVVSGSANIPAIQPHDKTMVSGSSNISAIHPPDKTMVSGSSKISAIQPPDKTMVSGSSNISAIQPPDKNMVSGSSTISAIQPPDKTMVSGSSNISAIQPPDKTMVSGSSTISAIQPPDKTMVSGSSTISGIQPPDKTKFLISENKPRKPVGAQSPCEETKNSFNQSSANIQNKHCYQTQINKNVEILNQRKSSSAREYSQQEVTQSKMSSNQSTFYNAARLAQEREDRERNIKKPQPGQKVYECGICSKIFNNLEQLREHAKMNLCPSKTCTICEKSFQSLDQLRFHLKVPCKGQREKMKDFEYTKIYVCSKCNFTSQNEKIGVKHVENCNVSSSPVKAKVTIWFKCHMCREVLHDKDVAYKHISKLCPQLKAVKAMQSAQKTIDKLRNITDGSYNERDTKLIKEEGICTDQLKTELKTNNGKIGAAHIAVDMQKVKQYSSSEPPKNGVNSKQPSEFSVGKSSNINKQESEREVKIVDQVMEKSETVLESRDCIDNVNLKNQEIPMTKGSKPEPVCNVGMNKQTEAVNVMKKETDLCKEKPNRSHVEQKGTKENVNEQKGTKENAKEKKGSNENVKEVNKGGEENENKYDKGNTIKVKRSELTLNKRTRCQLLRNESRKQRLQTLRKKRNIKRKMFFDEESPVQQITPPKIQKDEAAVFDESSSACKLCLYSTKEKRSLARHYTQAHDFGFKLQNRRYRCRYCDVSFQSSSKMMIKGHMMKHADILLKQIAKSKHLNRSHPYLTPEKRNSPEIKSICSPRKIAKVNQQIKARAARSKCAENLRKIVSTETQSTKTDNSNRNSKEEVSAIEINVNIATKNYTPLRSIKGRTRKYPLRQEPCRQFKDFYTRSRQKHKLLMEDKKHKRKHLSETKKLGIIRKITRSSTTSDICDIKLPENTRRSRSNDLKADKNTEGRTKNSGDRLNAYSHGVGSRISRKCREDKGNLEKQHADSKRCLRRSSSLNVDTKRENLGGRKTKDNMVTTISSEDSDSDSDSFEPMRERLRKRKEPIERSELKNESSVKGIADFVENVPSKIKSISHLSNIDSSVETCKKIQSTTQTTGKRRNQKSNIHSDSSDSEHLVDNYRKLRSRTSIVDKNVDGSNIDSLRKKNHSREKHEHKANEKSIVVDHDTRGFFNFRKRLRKGLQYNRKVKCTNSSDVVHRRIPNTRRCREKIVNVQTKHMDSDEDDDESDHDSTWLGMRKKLRKRSGSNQTKLETTQKLDAISSKKKAQNPNERDDSLSVSSRKKEVESSKTAMKKVDQPCEKLPKTKPRHLLESDSLNVEEQNKGLDSSYERTTPLKERLRERKSSSDQLKQHSEQGTDKEDKHGNSIKRYLLRRDRGSNIICDDNSQATIDKIFDAVEVEFDTLSKHATVEKKNEEKDFSKMSTEESVQKGNGGKNYKTDASNSKPVNDSHKVNTNEMDNSNNHSNIKEKINLVQTGKEKSTNLETKEKTYKNSFSVLLGPDDDCLSPTSVLKEKVECEGTNSEKTFVVLDNEDEFSGLMLNDSVMKNDIKKKVQTDTTKQVKVKQVDNFDSEFLKFTQKRQFGEVSSSDESESDMEQKTDSKISEQVSKRTKFDNAKEHVSQSVASSKSKSDTIIKEKSSFDAAFQAFAGVPCPIDSVKNSFEREQKKDERKAEAIKSQQTLNDSKEHCTKTTSRQTGFVGAFQEFFMNKTNDIDKEKPEQVAKPLTKLKQKSHKRTKPLMESIQKCKVHLDRLSEKDIEKYKQCSSHDQVSEKPCPSGEIIVLDSDDEISNETDDDVVIIDMEDRSVNDKNNSGEERNDEKLETNNSDYHDETSIDNVQNCKELKNDDKEKDIVSSTVSCTAGAEIDLYEKIQTDEGEGTFKQPDKNFESNIQDLLCRTEATTESSNIKNNVSAKATMIALEETSLVCNSSEGLEMLSNNKLDSNEDGTISKSKSESATLNKLQQSIVPTLTEIVQSSLQANLKDGPKVLNDSGRECLASDLHKEKESLLGKNNMIDSLLPETSVANPLANTSSVEDSVILPVSVECEVTTNISNLQKNNVSDDSTDDSHKIKAFVNNSITIDVPIEGKVTSELEKSESESKQVYYNNTVETECTVTVENVGVDLHASKQTSKLSNNRFASRDSNIPNENIREDGKASKCNEPDPSCNDTIVKCLEDLLESVSSQSVENSALKDFEQEIQSECPLESATEPTSKVQTNMGVKQDNGLLNKECEGGITSLNISEKQADDHVDQEFHQICESESIQQFVTANSIVLSSSDELMEGVTDTSTATSSSRDFKKGVTADSTALSSSSELMEAVTDNSTAMSSSSELMEGVTGHSDVNSTSSELKKRPTDDSTQMSPSSKLKEGVTADSTQMSPSTELKEGVTVVSTPMSPSSELNEGLLVDSTALSSSSDLKDGVTDESTPMSPSSVLKEGVTDDSGAMTPSSELDEGVTVDSTALSSFSELQEGVTEESTPMSPFSVIKDGETDDSATMSPSGELQEGVTADSTAMSLSGELQEGVTDDSGAMTPSGELQEGVTADSTAMSPSSELQEGVTVDSTAMSPSSLLKEGVTVDSTALSSSSGFKDDVIDESTPKCPSCVLMEGETDDSGAMSPSGELPEVVTADSTQMSPSSELKEGVTVDSTTLSSSRDLKDGVTDESTPMAPSSVPKEGVIDDSGAMTSSGEFTEGVIDDLGAMSPSDELQEGLADDSTPMSPSSVLNEGVHVDSSTLSSSSDLKDCVTEESTPMAPSNEFKECITESGAMSPSGELQERVTADSTQISPSSELKEGVTAVTNALSSSSDLKDGVTEKSTPIVPSRLLKEGVTDDSGAMTPSSELQEGATADSTQMSPSSELKEGVTAVTNALSSSSDLKDGVTEESTPIAPSSVLKEGVTDDSAAMASSSEFTEGVIDDLGALSPSGELQEGLTDDSTPMSPSSELKEGVTVDITAISSSSDFKGGITHDSTQIVLSGEFAESVTDDSTPMSPSSELKDCVTLDLTAISSSSDFKEGITDDSTQIVPSREFTESVTDDSTPMSPSRMFKEGVTDDLTAMSSSSEFKEGVTDISAAMPPSRESMEDVCLPGDTEIISSNESLKVNLSENQNIGHSVKTGNIDDNDKEIDLEENRDFEQKSGLLEENQCSMNKYDDSSRKPKSIPDLSQQMEGIEVDSDAATGSAVNQDSELDSLVHFIEMPNSKDSLNIDSQDQLLQNEKYYEELQVKAGFENLRSEQNNEDIIALGSEENEENNSIESTMNAIHSDVIKSTEQESEELNNTQFHTNYFSKSNTESAVCLNQVETSSSELDCLLDTDPLIKDDAGFTGCKIFPDANPNEYSDKTELYKPLKKATEGTSQLTHMSNSQQHKDVVEEDKAEMQEIGGAQISTFNSHSTYKCSESNSQFTDALLEPNFETDLFGQDHSDKELAKTENKAENYQIDKNDNQEPTNTIGKCDTYEDSVLEENTIHCSEDEEINSISLSKAKPINNSQTEEPADSGECQQAIAEELDCLELNYEDYVEIKLRTSDIECTQLNTESARYASEVIDKKNKSSTEDGEKVKSLNIDEIQKLETNLDGSSTSCLSFHDTTNISLQSGDVHENACVLKSSESVIEHESAEVDQIKCEQQLKPDVTDSAVKETENVPGNSSKESAMDLEHFSEHQKSSQIDDGDIQKSTNVYGILCNESYGNELSESKVSIDLQYTGQNQANVERESLPETRADVMDTLKEDIMVEDEAIIETKKVEADLYSPSKSDMNDDSTDGKESYSITPETVEVNNSESLVSTDLISPHDAHDVAKELTSLERINQGIPEQTPKQVDKLVVVTDVTQQNKLVDDSSVDILKPDNPESTTAAVKETTVINQPISGKFVSTIKSVETKSKVDNGSLIGQKVCIHEKADKHIKEILPEPDLEKDDSVKDRTLVKQLKSKVTSLEKDKQNKIDIQNTNFTGKIILESDKEKSSVENTIVKQNTLKFPRKEKSDVARVNLEDLDETEMEEFKKRTESVKQRLKKSQGRPYECDFNFEADDNREDNVGVKFIQKTAVDAPSSEMESPKKNSGNIEMDTNITQTEATCSTPQKNTVSTLTSKISSRKAYCSENNIVSKVLFDKVKKYSKKVTPRKSVTDLKIDNARLANVDIPDGNQLPSKLIPERKNSVPKFDVAKLQCTRLDDPDSPSSASSGSASGAESIELGSRIAEDKTLNAMKEFRKLHHDEAPFTWECDSDNLSDSSLKSNNDKTKSKSGRKSFVNVINKDKVVLEKTTAPCSSENLSQHSDTKSERQLKSSSVCNQATGMKILGKVGTLVQTESQLHKNEFEWRGKKFQPVEQNLSMMTTRRKSTGRLESSSERGTSLAKAHIKQTNKLTAKQILRSVNKPTKNSSDVNMCFPSDLPIDVDGSVIETGSETTHVPLRRHSVASLGSDSVKSNRAGTINATETSVGLTSKRTHSGMSSLTSQTHTSKSLASTTVAGSELQQANDGKSVSGLKQTDVNMCTVSQSGNDRNSSCDCVHSSCEVCKRKQKTDSKVAANVAFQCKKPAVRRLIHGGKVFEIQKGSITETEYASGGVAAAKREISPQPSGSKRKSALLQTDAQDTLSPKKKRTKLTKTEGHQEPDTSLFVKTNADLNKYIQTTLRQIRKQRQQKPSEEMKGKDSAESETDSKWKVTKKGSRETYEKYPYSFKRSRPISH